ncbi:MAG: OmpA family protein [Phenylobacterium sp.]|nr:OmpA family protein [Phenylobacterium sp.]
MTSPRSGGLAVVGAALALALAACDRAATGAHGTPLDIQVTHPAGVVLQIDTVSIGRDSTLVKAQILNGRDRDIELNAGRENTYLLTDAGEKILLAAPTANPKLTIPAGQSIDADLVFAGVLPRGERATLVINQQSRSDNVYSNSPRFEAVLPLDGARGGRDLPETSALSAMRPNPASRLGPTAAGASGLGAGALASSNLKVVEALRTELGAVQTERGSVVSLPSDVTFDFDKASIRQEGRGGLETLARLIQASGGDDAISIEGYTDSHGEEAYNLALSQRRAEAVKAFLVQQGVAEDRLRTVGLGEQRPVAPNARPDGSDDEDGRQRNRRVEVILPTVADGPALATNSGAASKREPAK